MDEQMESIDEGYLYPGPELASEGVSEHRAPLRAFPDAMVIEYDSQDIRATLESVGRLDLLGQATATAVVTEDCNIVEAWYSESNRPHLLSAQYVCIKENDQ